MRNSLLYFSLFLIIFNFASAISLRNDNGNLHANSGSSSRIQQTNNMTDILNHIENRNNVKRSPTFGSFIQVSLMSSTADDDNSANANNTMTEEEKKKEEERKAEEERQAAIRKSQQELSDYRAFAATLSQKLNDFLVQLKATQDNIWTQFSSNLTQALNQMKTTIDKEYNVSRQFIVNASDSTRQYIEKKKEEIRKGIEEIVMVSNVSLCETRELKILMFFFEQEEDTNKIEEYTADISKLQPKLPPMKSICNEYLDCGTCSANPSCGWCASRDKCIDGDEVGPLNEVCALYNYKICTGFNCGSKTDCASCLQEATCGWCEDQSTGTGTCLERASNYTGCGASDWYHSLGLQVACPLVDPSSPEGLQKEEKKKAWTQKKKERKETLEKMDELVPEEEKTIVSEQEDIIKWKQQIVERTAHLEYLNKEIEKVEEEIIHCQRDKMIYSMALKKAEGGG